MQKNQLDPWSHFDAIPEYDTHVHANTHTHKHTTTVYTMLA